MKVKALYRKPKFPIQLYNESTDIIFTANTEVESETDIKDFCNEFPIVLYNAQGLEIYYENQNGNWYKWEYNEQCKMIYFEDSKGFWWKKQYDEKGEVLYFVNGNSLGTNFKSSP